MDLSHYAETDTMLMPDVATMAHQLMMEHGLVEQGWYFTWDRAKKRLGQCKYGPKTISMSSILTPQRPMSEVRNTILHEIAHALVGHGAGHGPVWKAKAISIGCTGDRCSESSATVEHRWYATCPTCNLRVGMHRAPGRVRTCYVCAPWGFSWPHLIVWEEFGKVVPHNQMNEKYRREWTRLHYHFASLAEKQLDATLNPVSLIKNYR